MTLSDIVEKLTQGQLESILHDENAEDVLKECAQKQYDLNQKDLLLLEENGIDKEDLVDEAIAWLESCDSEPDITTEDLNRIYYNMVDDREQNPDWDEEAEEFPCFAKAIEIFEKA